MSTDAGRGRSLLATFIGYALVAIIVLVLFNALIGTILWLFRTVVIVAVLVGLLVLYLRLKAPDSD